MMKKGCMCMYIIKIEATTSGYRPPLQPWDSQTPAPEGYAFCSEEFHKIFYSTNPAGFVNIVVEDGSVIDMTINQEALNAYIATLPDPEPIEPKPTQLDIIEAQVTYTAMMTGTLLEV